MPITAFSETEYYRKLDLADAKHEAAEEAREEVYKTILEVMDNPEYFRDKPYPLGLFEAAIDRALDDDRMCQKLYEFLPDYVNLENEIDFAVLVDYIAQTEEGREVLKDIAEIQAQSLEDNDLLEYRTQF